jgi:hypothetical protein
MGRRTTAGGRAEHNFYALVECPIKPDRLGLRLEADPRKDEYCAAIRTLPLAELLDQRRPHSPDFPGIIDSCLHQDQLRGWIADWDRYWRGCDQSADDTAEIYVFKSIH